MLIYIINIIKPRVKTVKTITYISGNMPPAHSNNESIHVNQVAAIDAFVFSVPDKPINTIAQTAKRIKGVNSPLVMLLLKLTTSVKLVTLLSVMFGK